MSDTDDAAIVSDDGGALRVALADMWAFYFLAHSSHWNVTGPLFNQLHSFFNELYDDAHDAVDGLAEQLRAMGLKAPSSPTDIIKGSKVKFVDASTDARGMVAALAAGNACVLASLDAAQEKAEAADEEGLANYLQDRIDRHKKHGWMLDASLSGKAPVRPSSNVVRTRMARSRLQGVKA